MCSVEKTAKTVDEAVQQALAELKAEMDQVEVTIVEAGAKGLFGIGSRPAKVVVKRKFDPEGTAKTFLREIAAAMAIQVEIETELKEWKLHIELKGPDMGVLIGKRGQTLDSLQYLVSLVVNKGLGPYVNVTLDSENYRKRRKETLENLAVHLAKKARHTRRNVVLEPMSAYERRIIHAVLQQDKFVNTYSEGEEPYRNVVIAPK